MDDGDVRFLLVVHIDVLHIVVILVLFVDHVRINDIVVVGRSAGLGGRAWRTKWRGPRAR
jgi:hypothetical protein